MEELGIEKTWNTNVRMPNASSSTSASEMAQPARERTRDGGALRAASGPPAARPGVPPRSSGAPPKSAVGMPVTAVRCAAPAATARIAVPRMGGA